MRISHSGGRILLYAAVAALLVFGWPRAGDTQLAPVPSSAASPKGDFESNELLLQAETDVVSMPPAELDLFSALLASCGSATTNGGGMYDCKRDTSLYGIHYGRGRPLDRLLAAMGIASLFGAALDQTAKPNSAESAQRAKLTMRTVEVQLRLEAAANAAYRRTR